MGMGWRLMLSAECTRIGPVERDKVSDRLSSFVSAPNAPAQPQHHRSMSVLLPRQQLPVLSASP